MKFPHSADARVDVDDDATETFSTCHGVFHDTRFQNTNILNENSTYHKLNFLFGKSLINLSILEELLVSCIRWT